MPQELGPPAGHELQPGMVQRQDEGLSVHPIAAVGSLPVFGIACLSVAAWSVVLVLMRKR